jgi:hypothetical protein
MQFGWNLAATDLDNPTLAIGGQVALKRRPFAVRHGDQHGMGQDKLRSRGLRPNTGQEQQEQPAERRTGLPGHEGGADGP